MIIVPFPILQWKNLFRLEQLGSCGGYFVSPIFFVLNWDNVTMLSYDKSLYLRSGGDITHDYDDGVNSDSS